MNGALLELLWRNLAGSLVQRARRLRNPRYLVAFLASAAYFGFLVLPSFLRWTRGGSGASGPFGVVRVGAGGTAAQAEALRAALPVLTLVMSLGFALGLTLLWLLASSKPALQLGGADLDLLLPAPLPRRKLIELALWRQQLGLLLGALVLALLRGYGPPAARLQRFFTAWAVLTLMSLHAKGVSLWKARLRELPPAAARMRVALAVGGGAAFWTTIVLALRRPLAPLMQALTGPESGGTPATAQLREVVHRLAVTPPPLLGWLLAPFRWFAAAVLSRGVNVLGGPGGQGGLGAMSGIGGTASGAPPAGVLPALPGWAAALFLLGLVALHYEWVVRSAARFEDAVEERARRQVEQRRRRPALPAPLARARSREPFALAPSGLPEVAIVWKNLLLGSRAPLRRRLALAAASGLAVWALGAALGAPPALTISAAMTGWMLMALLPLTAGLGPRHDLRHDLLHVELLRPWPVAGWRLVAAEVVAPALGTFTWLLAGWSLVLGAALAAAGRRQPGQGDPLQLALHPASLRGAAGTAGAGASGGLYLAFSLSLALLILGAALVLVGLALQNLGVLALPGWIALGAEPRGRSALAGQRILVLLAQLVALALGLVPGALLVGLALLAGRWAGLALAPWQAPLLALLAALPLLAEAALLVRLGGALWDRLDPAEELLNPEGA